MDYGISNCWFEQTEVYLAIVDSYVQKKAIVLMGCYVF